MAAGLVNIFVSDLRGVSSAEVKKMWIYTPPPPYAFMA
jgi:hypothetical protein